MSDPEHDRHVELLKRGALHWEPGSHHRRVVVETILRDKYGVECPELLDAPRVNVLATVEQGGVGLSRAARKIRFAAEVLHERVKAQKRDHRAGARQAYADFMARGRED